MQLVRDKKKKIREKAELKIDVSLEVSYVINHSRSNDIYRISPFVALLSTSFHFFRDII